MGSSVARRARSAVEALRIRAVRLVAWCFVGLAGTLVLYNIVFFDALPLLVDTLVLGVFAGVALRGERIGPELSSYALAVPVVVGSLISSWGQEGLWHSVSGYAAIATVTAGLLGGRRPTLVVGLLGAAGYLALLGAHGLGWVETPGLARAGAEAMRATLHQHLADKAAILLAAIGVTYAFVVMIEGAFARWSEAVAEANAAREAQARFLASMSHELRTPLHGVLGSLELVRGEGLDEQDRGMLRVAHSSADVLLALINDVLDFSRLESGRVEVDLVPSELRTLLDNTIAPLRVLASGKGISLLLEVDDEVPLWLLVDPAKTRQIVLNLVGNAVKFTSEGLVRVQVRWAEERLELQVTDSGIGMTPDQLRTLFDAYVQADASVSRRFGGTGLGLSIVAGLLEVLGGQVRVASTPGEGTTFTVDLPATVAEGLEQASVALDEEPGASLRVLVVDDHPVNRHVIRAMLERDEHEVRVASDGEEALEILAREVVDVVLMDVHMPGLDGYEATRRARSLPSPFCSVPILALTASPDAEHRERAREAGMDDLLGKPLDRAALATALSRWSGGRAHRAAG